ncbi:MAG: hypothetical protein Q9163_005987, partial [Psora crenata]
MHKFRTEVGILKALDEHPRIVQYLGPLDELEPTKDLLFTEAVNGDLQRYLDAHGESISLLLRLNADLDISRFHYFSITHGSNHGSGKEVGTAVIAQEGLAFVILFYHTTEINGGNWGPRGGSDKLAAVKSFKSSPETAGFGPSPQNAVTP